MMLKSKNIADYFEAKLTDLRAGEVVPFDIFLYFPQNMHILTWKKAGDLVTDGFIDRYRSRGVDKFWVHNSDAELYRRYLNPATPVQTASVAAPGEPLAPAPQAPKEFRTIAGQNIVEIMKSPDLQEKQKAALVAKSARAVLSQAAMAESVPEQKDALARARDVVADVLDHALEKSHSVAREIWKLANIDPELDHAVNVSTFSVIFAMAFGRIDKDLISDIATAGLLHDVGISQVPAQLAPMAWKAMRPPELKQYSEHVQGGLDLIQLFAPEVSDRVKSMIFQHHEKFDGTGYPRRLQGFKMDDVSQLLAIADLLDSISSGQWDGVERTLMETFTTLETVEKARTFPEYFNPEVFGAVLRWIRNYTSQDSASEAIQIVEKQVRALVEQSKF